MKNLLHLSLTLLFSGLLFAQQDFQAERKHANVENDHLAVQGYDLISYFKENKPQKGDSTWKSSHNGLIYFFSSEANKLMFDKNPEEYLPQFGGWCAYAMGQKNKKVEINPQAYSIENGKLYLFYRSYFNDTLEKWNENNDNLRIAAESNWSKTISKK